MRRPAVWLSAIAIVILGSLVAGAAVKRATAQDSASAAANHPLVGAWIVDQNVGDTADPPALSIFMAEGTSYESNPTVGNGVGVWMPTGARTAAATFAFQVLGEGGAVQATVKARADIAVDASGDAFTSTYAFEGTAPDGTVLFAGQATGRATRLVVEPRISVATPSPATPSS